MKRILIAAAAAVLLAGCTTYAQDLTAVVNDKLAEVQSEPAGKPYYNSTYYYYYVDPSIGRISSDRTSNVLAMNGTKFVMNLNVPGIIQSTYYTDAAAADSTVQGLTTSVSTSGSYIDYDGNENEYQVYIYQMDGSYYTIVSTPTMEFYSFSGKYEAAEIAAEMVRIARSVRIRKDQVLADFSNRQVISYSRKKLELFQNIAPENGVVDELFADHNNYAGISGGTQITGGNYATDNYPDAGTAAEDQATPEPTAQPSASPSPTE